MTQRTSAASRPGRSSGHAAPGEIHARVQRGQPPGRDGQASSARASSARGGDAVAAARLTGRGAMLAMFSLFFPGTLTSGWLHLGALAGISFLAGCVLAGLYTKREDLLLVLTTPPLIFLAAVICVTAMSSNGGGVLSSVSGIALILAAAAPWLFAGELAIIVISLFRGLPRSIRNLRADLRGDP
jgi:hypothetical protein